MNILFGVAASGSGHIERAKILIPRLEAEGAKVTCLVSGEVPQQNLNFGQTGGDIIFHDGFHIKSKNGKLHVMQTACGMAATLPKAINDARKINMDNYDLVISDFEPISAFAAQISEVKSIGLAHQFALKNSEVPNPHPRSPYMICMKRIVPVDIELGLHWHPYGENILPPIIRNISSSEKNDPRKILVYLNFDNITDIKNVLKPFVNHDFYIYSKQVKEESNEGNLYLRPISPTFKTDFSNCAGIITGAGFMSASEALQMEKKLLVKPMIGHTEQQSNALTLETLNLGRKMNSLNPQKIQEWLGTDTCERVHFTDTAQLVTEWISQ